MLELFYFLINSEILIRTGICTLVSTNSRQVSWPAGYSSSVKDIACKPDPAQRALSSSLQCCLRASDQHTAYKPAPSAGGRAQDWPSAGLAPGTACCAFAARFWRRQDPNLNGLGKGRWKGYQTMLAFSSMLSVTILDWFLRIIGLNDDTKDY